MRHVPNNLSPILTSFQLIRKIIPHSSAFLCCSFILRKLGYILVRPDVLSKNLQFLLIIIVIFPDQLIFHESKKLSKNRQTYQMCLAITRSEVTFVTVISRSSNQLAVDGMSFVSLSLTLSLSHILPQFIYLSTYLSIYTFLCIFIPFYLSFFLYRYI